MYISATKSIPVSVDVIDLVQLRQVSLVNLCAGEYFAVFVKWPVSE